MPRLLTMPSSFATWSTAALLRERDRLALLPVLRAGPQAARLDAIDAALESRKWLECRAA